MVEFLQGCKKVFIGCILFGLHLFNNATYICSMVMLGSTYQCFSLLFILFPFFLFQSFFVG